MVAWVKGVPSKPRQRSCRWSSRLKHASTAGASFSTRRRLSANAVQLSGTASSIGSRPYHTNRTGWIYETIYRL